MGVQFGIRMNRLGLEGAQKYFLRNLSSRSAFPFDFSRCVNLACSLLSSSPSHCPGHAGCKSFYCWHPVGAISGAAAVPSCMVVSKVRRTTGLLRVCAWHTGILYLL